MARRRPQPRLSSGRVTRRPLVLATLLPALALGAPAAQAASPPVTVSAKAIAKPLTTKAAKTTVVVRNAGKGRLAGLSLTASAPKHVTVTVAGAKRGARTRTLPTLKAGRSVRVTVTLRRASKKAPTAGSATVKVRRRGKTVATGRIAFGPPAATAPTTPTPPPVNRNTLAGRTFWGSKYTLNGIEQYTLSFTGDTLVYTGDLAGAWPTCTAVADTCKAYAYDAATNGLTIDGQPATLTGQTLTLDGQTYRELGAPTPGGRWDTVLTYSNSSGICPLYCNYYTEYLTFRPDGTFIRSAVSSGSGPVVDYAVVPADSKGTYEIRADRTLALSFADGKQRVETLGIYPADDGSYPANPSAGIVLDSDGYFDIR
jgi:hypothetical protein